MPPKPIYRRPPPSPACRERMKQEHIERVKVRATAYLAHKNFPQLDGDVLPIESLLEAVLHYAEQDLPPEIDPDKERQAREQTDRLHAQTYFHGTDKKKEED